MAQKEAWLVCSRSSTQHVDLRLIPWRRPSEKGQLKGQREEGEGKEEHTSWLLRSLEGGRQSKGPWWPTLLAWWLRTWALMGPGAHLSCVTFCPADSGQSMPLH